MFLVTITRTIPVRVRGWLKGPALAFHARKVSLQSPYAQKTDQCESLAVDV